MACEKLQHWDWKSGRELVKTVGGIKLDLNYFTCGTYYNDGRFNVVKFPKGMSLYHGSYALANALAEMPVGKRFYEPHDIAKPSDLPNKLPAAFHDSDESVEAAVSEYVPVNVSWYGTLKTAKLYSLQTDVANTCGEQCVAAYKLTNDAVFLVLNDEENILRIMSHPSTPTKIYADLKNMFTIESMTDFGRSAYNRIGYEKTMLRKSARTWDLEFADWFCGTFGKDYAGYAANNTIADAYGYFHEEFTFCNATKYLRRDLFNKLDWQYRPVSVVTVVAEFMKQMSYYKSSNVEFHAGDLLDHSIWSALWAEKLLNADSDPSLTRERKKTIVALAFIHDIGKMAPDQMRCRRHDCVYFTVPTHPKIGGDYVRGAKPMPKLNENAQVVGALDLDGLLAYMDVNDREEAAAIVDLHWEFGDFVRKLHLLSREEDVRAAAEAYVAKCGAYRSYDFYHALTIVSRADVLASQPIGVDQLNRSLNIQSKFFAFIKNVPKKYEGGNVAQTSAGIRDRFAQAVLDVVRNRGSILEREKRAKIERAAFANRWRNASYYVIYKYFLANKIPIDVSLTKKQLLIAMLDGPPEAKTKFVDFFVGNGFAHTLYKDLNDVDPNNVIEAKTSSYLCLNQDKPAVLQEISKYKGGREKQKELTRWTTDNLCTYLEDLIIFGDKILYKDVYEAFASAAYSTIYKFYTDKGIDLNTKLDKRKLLESFKLQPDYVLAEFVHYADEVKYSFHNKTLSNPRWMQRIRDDSLDCVRSDKADIISRLLASHELVETPEQLVNMSHKDLCAYAEDTAIGDYLAINAESVRMETE